LLMAAPASQSPTVGRATHTRHTSLQWCS
jgi:hypothetical protein